ncbi:hypothetical protein MMC27_001297 [Xylographa pallens]|nr:hypothetical protein [Xylographa pallens]
MGLSRRMSQLSSVLSGSRRRSNTSQISTATQESKERRTPNISQSSGLSNPFTSRMRSQTTVPDKRQSATIDESDIVLHLLHMDIAMHSYFCFHNNPDYRYPGSWVRKTLQQSLTHVPILYPKDPSAYQDWVVSSAIDFIEQHTTNINRLSDLLRRVKALEEIDETKNYAVPISRSTNSDVARLIELVRKLKPRLGKPKDRAELFELTNICISSLKRQLVAIDEDWDFHKNPWGGVEVGSIDDMWDYVHSSHGRTTFNNKELASVVELIYSNYVNIDAQPPQEDSDDQEQPDPDPEPIEKDGYLIPSSRERRRHLHTEASSDPEKATLPHSRQERRSRKEHRPHPSTERTLQREKEQEEYIERLKRHRARKEQEEAEHLQVKGLHLQGKEKEYFDYRQQRRLRKEESEQEHLDHMRRNRMRRERKQPKRRWSGTTPRDEDQMVGGL